MNKSEFIKELSKQTSYNEERCNTINNIYKEMVLYRIISLFNI